MLNLDLFFHIFVSTSRSKALPFKNLILFTNEIFDAPLEDPNFSTSYNLLIILERAFFLFHMTVLISTSGLGETDGRVLVVTIIL